MAEHTPTTSDIRQQYIKDYDVFGRVTHDVRASDEFDRWLCEVKAHVWDEGKDAVARAFLRDAEPLKNPYREEADHE